MFARLPCWAPSTTLGSRRDETFIVAVDFSGGSHSVQDVGRSHLRKNSWRRTEFAPPVS